ncbi:MAG: hypothetical protein EPO40_07260 [Myxococcaceae bacterium]|nr:MAG: hypothetical protein EPO40_07260 [Myxococcaceae bacterium]
MRVSMVATRAPVPGRPAVACSRVKRPRSGSGSVGSAWAGVTVRSRERGLPAAGAAGAAGAGAAGAAGAGAGVGAEGGGVATGRKAGSAGAVRLHPAVSARARSGRWRRSVCMADHSLAGGTSVNSTRSPALRWCRSEKPPLTSST